MCPIFASRIRRNSRTRGVAQAASRVFIGTVAFTILHVLIAKSWSAIRGISVYPAANLRKGVLAALLQKLKLAGVLRRLGLRRTYCIYTLCRQALSEAHAQHGSARRSGHVQTLAVFNVASRARECTAARTPRLAWTVRQPRCQAASALSQLRGNCWVQAHQRSIEAVAVRRRCRRHLLTHEVTQLEVGDRVRLMQRPPPDIR